MTNHNSFRTKKRRLGSDNELGYGSTLDWSAEIADSSGVSAASGKVVPASGTVVSDGLVHHYTFADATAADQVGSADGTVYGASPVPSGGPQGGGSFDFDGSNDYIDISSNTLDHEPVTVSMWLNFDSIGTQDVFIHGYDSDNYMVIWTTGGGNDLGYVVDARNDRSQGYLGSLETNHWYHLAYANDGDSISFYVDGTEVASSGVATFSYTPDKTYIGTNLGASNYYSDIQAASVRLYNRALSSSEVESIWKAERA